MNYLLNQTIEMMAPISRLVDKLISRKEDFCQLCFSNIGPTAVKMQDEVVVDNTKPQNTKEMSEILTFILGGRFSTELSALDSICGTCTETAKVTYRFIKTCHENSEILVNTLDTLNDCIENTPNDVNNFNTLFITIDTSDFSSKQYYDSKNIPRTKSTALMKFRSLSHSTNKLQVKQKAHRYSTELLEICDIIREKNTPTKYKCKVCLNIFSKSFNFKKHFYSQHSPKVLKCPDCDKSYGSEALLKQHRYDCHSNIMCSECGKTYTNRYSLLYHIRRHTGEQPYKCKFCGLKFQWSSRRAEHIRRYHMDPAVECDICHLKFRTLGSLYDHRKRHFNPNSRLHVRLEQTGEVIEEGIVDDVMNVDIG